jgi:adenylosuccinate synthase
MKSGKLNIVIDGQFGSTGKGLICSYIGVNEHIDVAVTNAAPNAGHTFIDTEGNKKVAKHLPVSTMFDKRSTIYLCAGAIINPKVLLKEIKDFDIDPDRICIHPRAAIIDEIDITNELRPDSSQSKIASTRSGVGEALSRKVLRSSLLAEGCKELAPFIKELDLQLYMDNHCSVLMEVPQGFDLSLNSGLSYPYCTSREVTISAALSDAQVHPYYLGNVMMSIRTFPIRVGNLVINNNEIGYSGPFYPDSKEVTWKYIGVEEELTTNTKRVRRVATFSIEQYKRAVERLRPTHVFLNFVNYIRSEKRLKKLLEEMDKIRKVNYIGTGSTFFNVHEV